MTFPVGDTPEGAANYTSLAAFAAKTEEDWTADLTSPVGASATAVRDGFWGDMPTGESFGLTLLKELARRILPLDAIEDWTFISDVLAAIDSWGTDLNALINDVLRDLIDFFGNLLDRSGFLEVLQIVTEFFMGVGEGLGGFLTVLEEVITFFAEILDRAGFFEILRVVIEFFGGITDGVLDTFLAVLKAVVEFFMDITEGSLEVVFTVLTDIINFFGDLIDRSGFLDVLRQVVDFFAAAGGGALGTVLTALGDILDFLMGLVDRSGFLDVLRQVIDFFAGIADGVRAGFLDMISNIVGLFDSIGLPDFTFQSLIDAILGGIESIALTVLPLNDIRTFIEKNLTGPIIAALTGDAFKLDVGALGVWASNLLGRGDKIPAENLIGQISTALFGVIPLSNISNDQPNLLTAGGFDAADIIDGDSNWGWEAVGRTGTGGCLKCSADGGAHELYSTQSIPAAQGDKIRLSAWIKTDGYTGSGSPIILSVIPFQGTVQQAAVTMIATGSRPSWTQLSGEYSVPADVTSLRVRIAITNGMSSGQAYFDDVALTKTGLLQQGWVERLTDAWNNFWHGVFGGVLPTDKSVDDVFTAAASVSSTANTAAANATDALSQLGTLLWNLLNAPAAAIGSLVDVVMDGVATVGSFLSDLWAAFTGTAGADKTVAQVATAATSVTATATTASSTASTAVANAATAQSTADTANSAAGTANTNLQITWDELVNAFDGTTTATGKTPSNVRQRGAVVRTSAITGETQSSTALVNAATADGKAAVAKELAKAGIGAGPNIASNGDFERDTYIGVNAVRSTESPRTGTYSAKITQTGSYYGFINQAVTDTGTEAFPVSPGDIFYIEFWAKGLSTNTETPAGQNIWFQQGFNRSGGLATTNGSCGPTALNSLHDDQWHFISGTITAPDYAYETPNSFIATHHLAPAGNVYFVDNVRFYRVTEGYVADGKAVAAQATANTGVTNAATADGKAVVAQSAAATADAKAVAAQTMLDQKILSGSSITTNGGFEDTTQYLGNVHFTYSTEQKYSGTYSAKFLSTAQYVALYGTTNTTGSFGVPALPGQVFYMEIWVKGHPSNALTASSSNIVLIAYFDGANAIIVNEKGPTQIGSSNWYKLAGYVTVPEGAVTIRPRIDVRQYIPVGDIYYFDQFRCVEVTDAYAAKLAADAAQATANTGVTNAATADAKAVAAQALLDASANAGANMIPDPSFENSTFDQKRLDCCGSYASWFTHTTEEKHSGTRCVKLTLGGQTWPSMNLTPSLNRAVTGNRPTWIPTKAGRTYYVSQWVYLKSPNAGTRETSLYLMTFDEGFTAPGYQLIQTFPPLDTWTQIEGYLTITDADAAYMVPLFGAFRPGNDTGSVMYLDDVVLIDVTDAYNAKILADAAQAQANTATTNAATADAKAVTADGKAVTADTKAGVAQSVGFSTGLRGANILPNGDFENSNFYVGTSTKRWLDTSEKHSGTQSLRHTGYQWTPLFANADTFMLKSPCRPGDKLACEVWIKGHPDNVATGSRTAYIQVQFFKADGTIFSPNAVYAFQVNAGTGLNGVWTKVSGTATAPADAYFHDFTLVTYVPEYPDNVYWWDDAKCYRITEAYDAQIDADAAAASAATGIANAATADGKAVVADGKAVTADTKAVVAQSTINKIALSGGTNKVISPTMEDSTVARMKYSTGSTLSYDTSEKYSGSQSLKMTIDTANWNGFYLAPLETLYRMDCKPGDVIYSSLWFKPAATNQLISGGYMRLFIRFFQNQSGGGYTDSIVSGTYQVNCQNMTGGWQKLEVIGICPADRTKVDVFVLANGTNPPGEVYWFDNADLRDITEAYYAQLDADAAQAQANTATTNAATADAKAVTADGKAVTADGKAVVAQGLAQAMTGANLLTNFGFEDTNLWNSSLLSTEQKYEGARSLKLTNAASGVSYHAPFQAGLTTNIKFPVAAYDYFYFEMMVFPHASNSAGNYLRVYMRGDTAAGAQVATPGINFTNASLTKGQWNKISGYLSIGNIPTVANGILYLFFPAEEAGNVYYFDNAILYRVTEGEAASVEAAAAAAAATEGITNAATADGKAVAINQALYGQTVPGATIAQAKVASLPTDLSNLGAADAATNNAVYNAFFGSGGTGTAANVSTAITAIKEKLVGGWTVQSITTTSTWTRPWTPGSVDEPTEFWAIAVGSGSGGGKGRSGLGGAAGGIGGIGGKWLAKRIDPADITSTVSVTIAAGGAGVNSGSGNASPNNGSDTSFGSLCATSSAITASIADFIGYYSCEDSRPGTGGTGGSEGGGAQPGTAGESTPMAAGGAAGVWGVNNNAGSVGGTAVLTGSTRAGGGGGGGGYGGTGVVAPGVGGAGGWPGGGGGGGGATWNVGSTAGAAGGNGGNGAVILIWK